MNLALLRATIGIILTAAIVATFAHPVASTALSRTINPMNLPLLHATLPGQKAIMAKQAAATAPRLSRVNLYSWENGAWTPDGPLSFIYDNRGRIIEIVDGSSPEDSTLLKQTFEYDDAGSKMRMVSYTKDSSTFFSYESYEIMDYYYNDRQSFTNAFVSGDPLMLFQLSTPQSRGIDSMRTIYMFRDLGAPEWDTTNNSKTTYEYTAGTIRVTTRSNMAASPTSDPENLEYVYHLNASGRLDSISVTTISTAGVRSAYMRMIYTYGTGDKVSLIALSLAPGEDFGFFEEEIHITYLASGLPSSYIIKMQEDPDSAMVDIGKMEFVYEGVGTLSSRHYSPHTPVTMTEYAGRYRLSSSTDCIINSVALFDLNGRMVNSYRFAGQAAGKPVAIPLNSRSGSVRVVRVQTSQGVYHFSIKRAAPGTRRN